MNNRWLWILLACGTLEQCTGVPLAGASLWIVAAGSVGMLTQLGVMVWVDSVAPTVNTSAQYSGPSAWPKQFCASVSALSGFVSPAPKDQPGHLPKFSWFKLERAHCQKLCTLWACTTSDKWHHRKHVLRIAPLEEYSVAPLPAGALLLHLPHTKV